MAEIKPAGKETPNPAGDQAAADAAAKAAADQKAAGDKKAADDKSKGAEGVKADESTLSDDEKKAAAEKAAAEAKAAEEAAKPKAPEKYELTAPKDSLIDASDIGMIEKLAREHELSNDDAQGLLEQQAIILAQQSEQFLAELKANKTYGGDKLAETQRLAGEALNKLRPLGGPKGDGLRQLLKRGYGNHIEVASLLADLGKTMQEDGTNAGNAGGGDRKDKPIAQRMYPNAKS